MTVYLDNPAGRLYGLLARLAEQGGETAIIDGWATVLEVRQDDVALRLGGAAEQIRQIQSAVDRVGVAALRPTVERYREDWEAPIHSRQHALNVALKNVLPGAAALEALDMVSAHLHEVAPEGEVPDEAEREGIESQLRNVIEIVQEDEKIPAEMKHLLIARLRDVEEAIEHLNVGGPGAVRHATEALMGAAALEGTPRFWNFQTAQSILAIAAILWTGFSSGQEVQGNLKAWGEMLQLGPGIERSVDDDSTAPDPEPVPRPISDDKD